MTKIECIDLRGYNPKSDPEVLTYLGLRALTALQNGMPQIANVIYRTMFDMCDSNPSLFQILLAWEKEAAWGVERGLYLKADLDATLSGRGAVH